MIAMAGLRQPYFCALVTGISSNAADHDRRGSCRTISGGGFGTYGRRRHFPAYNGLRLGRPGRKQILRFQTPIDRLGNMVHRSTGEGAGAATAGLGGGVKKMSIVFVSAEVAPWSKTGGLGDVLGGLPPALAARGHRVMTVSPRYDQYKDAWDTNVTIEVKAGADTEIVRLFHTFERGVDRLFVDHPSYLAKVWGETGERIYGPTAGVDYNDNQFRFGLLCQAAIEAVRVLDLNSNEFFRGPYGLDVVFVANDWHTALLPCYLKSRYKARGLFTNAKVAFCVHNIAYQGRFAFADFENLGLPILFQSSFAFMDGTDTPIKGLKINWLKAAFLQSDKLLTVSPTYAKELTQGPQRGVELDDVARKAGIVGIANGMDVREWDPSTDKFIEANYDAATVMDAKPTLKEALQTKFGLPVILDVPVIGFIGRLEEQKGSDILVEAALEFLEGDIQLICLGTGKKYLERQLKELEEKFPGKARTVLEFSAPLAHTIIAGADYLLIPSRFEPCGLTQLHAMRYGTPPIVASTGGLIDTVQDGITGYHVGAPFNPKCDVVDPADVKALSETVRKAVDDYKSSKYFSLIKAGMAQDLSWQGPAQIWEDILFDLCMEDMATES